MQTQNLEMCGPPVADHCVIPFIGTIVAALRVDSILFPDKEHNTQINAQGRGVQDDKQLYILL